MRKIVLDLKNCYGIRALKYTFDFGKQNAILVYAPNGVMKTSLANIFDDLSQGEPSNDRLYPSRKPKVSIIDDRGADLNPESILVIQSDRDELDRERMATLLVNQELRDKYESIHTSIENAKEALLSTVGKTTHLGRYVESAILADLKKTDEDIYLILDQIAGEVSHGLEVDLSDVAYTTVFNEKTNEFLSSEEFSNLLATYLSEYDRLVEQSQYFRKGVFNHYNASTVAKSLKANNFFRAKHSVSLANKDGQKTEMGSQAQLDKAIAEEKTRLLEGTEADFSSIEKAMDRNAELRKLRDYLIANPHLLSEMRDLGAFKRRLWISYLIANVELYTTFCHVYNNGKADLAGISKMARGQETRWQKVVNVFNRRFAVPFRLSIKNKEDVILKDELPNVAFTCIDGQDSCEVEHEDLLPILCAGERRALSILNIIFKIEAKKDEGGTTLLIIDDIADSFDYKNKYAIIEYLKEIHETGKFLMIILTHNFDFFRTVQSRLYIDEKINCLVANKTESEVQIAAAQNIMRPLSTWKGQLESNPRARIAAIPMVRNLIEYTKSSADPDYLKLTSLLHLKADSGAITMKDLATIFGRSFHAAYDFGIDPVLPAIFAEADRCMRETDSVSLENKIVLSIAIRLLAEQGMKARMNISDSEDASRGQQLARLFEKFKSMFGPDHPDVKLLEQVFLMTPEIIHLNSFMYEPIVDLSDWHLKNLLTNIKTFAGSN